MLWGANNCRCPSRSLMMGTRCIYPYIRGKKAGNQDTLISYG